MPEIEKLQDVKRERVEGAIEPFFLRSQYIRAFVWTSVFAAGACVLPFAVGLVLHLYSASDWKIILLSVGTSVPLVAVSFLVYRHVTIKFLFSKLLDRYTYLTFIIVVLGSLTVGLLDLIAKLQLIKYQ